jgi:Pectate lyase superfamily protein
MAIVTTAGIVNVMDNGAKGTGIDDDTEAVQAAINAAGAMGTNRADQSWNGGVVYFPPGQYRITKQLVLPVPPLVRSQVNLIGSGKKTCKLMGEVNNDYLISSCSWGACFGVIEGLTIANAYGVFMDLVANVVIRDCEFYCAINALNLGGTSGNVYNTTVYNCMFQGACDADGIMTPGSVGIYSAQAEFYNISVVNYDIGFAGWNIGIVVMGSRFEVNNTAIVLGKAPPNGTDQLAAFKLSTISFERNDTAIYVNNAYTGELDGLAFTGTVSPYFGPGGAYTNDLPIQSVSWAAGVATITTAVPHGIAKYLSVVREGGSTFGGSIYDVSVPGYNTYAVCTVTGPSTITYPLAANPGSTGFGGKICVQPCAGLRAWSGGALSFNGVNAGGDFSNAGFDLYSSDLGNSVFSACSASSGNGAGGQGWKMPNRPVTTGQVKYFGCNNPPVVLSFSQLPGQDWRAMPPQEGMEFDISDAQKADATAALTGSDLGTPVIGGGKQHAKIRYNGTHWTCMGL